MIAAFWRPASSPSSWYLKAIRPRTSAIRGRSTRSGIAARRRPDRSRRSRLEQPVGRNKRSALRDCRKEGRKRLMALHKGRPFGERAGALALAAALPAIIQNKRMIIGIFGLGANKQYKYARYFSMNSQGASPRNYSRGLFELAIEQQPKPRRAALVGADVEFSRNALDGARENAKEPAFALLYERTYPLANPEYTAIARAMQAADTQMVYAATLPVDTVGLLRASNEVQFRPKLYGGAFLGLLVTAIKQQLGPLTNGLVNNEFYIPAASLQFAGTREFLDEYQKRAPGLGIDPLGFTYPPYAYVAGQILAKAASETKSLDDETLADYIP